MKQYRELYFKGTSKQLNIFVNEISNSEVTDWKNVKDNGHLKNYLLFNYIGDDVNKAQISIYLGDRIESGVLNVGNIVPLEKNNLDIDEYNKILLKFYNEVIRPYKESGTDLNIIAPSDDIFDPKSVISEIALDKLRRFCFSANKSTGSSHPCDKERWFDFICQTVDDERVFDYTTLATFLQDKTYWGEKSSDFIGVMGRFAWDEENAYELASEYSNLCDVLKYYKKTRGI